jgi:hypothetical protein
MSKILGRSLLILTALLLVRGDFIYFKSMPSTLSDDFWVYYTGAWVVRSGPTANLYEAANRSVDSSDVFYDESATPPVADNIFVETGRTHGIPVLSVYIYPPTLADLLLPLTFISTKAALTIWYLLNTAALLAVSALLALITVRSRRLQFVAILVFMLLLPPVVAAIAWGQITIILLFLIVAGIHLYLRGKRMTAAFLFALAAAIKLTPLIVIFPLIAWRDWKTVRALVLWCAVILFALVAINGWGALQLYFLHEMPKIGSDSVWQNRTLGSMLQALFLKATSNPKSLEIAKLAKILSLACICYATWLSRTGRKFAHDDNVRFEIFAAFFLLSCCISPMSWEHAYTLGAPLLLLWSQRSWKDTGGIDLAFLILFGLTFSTYRFHFLPLITPLPGIAISIATLYRVYVQKNRERSLIHAAELVGA